MNIISIGRFRPFFDRETDIPSTREIANIRSDNASLLSHDFSLHSHFTIHDDQTLSIDASSTLEISLS